jgi:hypothetical protein
MAKPKTTKIRIAVAVDAAGEWSAAGWKGARDAEAMESAVDAGGELSGTHQQYYMTIEVPLPRPIELTAATVEEGPLVSEAPTAEEE